jgi:hypothetical protein
VWLTASVRGLYNPASGPRSADIDSQGVGVWATSGDRVPWLKKGGMGTVPIAFHLQFRPNPLAD